MNEQSRAPVAEAGHGDEQFRVPKVKVTVELILDGGQRVAGEVHLLPVAGRHAGRERVLDLLSRPDRPFLPLSMPGRARLVHQQRVVAARVSDPIDAGIDEGDQPTGGVAAIEVELAGLPEGENRISGEISLNLPQGRRRVIDYLNREEPFFCLSCEEGLLLINKTYVLDVLQSG